MRLVERDRELAAVAEAVREAAAGHGSVLLVSGEAGIGKSFLVRAVRDRLPAEGRMLVGLCDSLATARVLGPLHDLSWQVGEELGDALSEGDRNGILTALIGELDGNTVLVIEDVHWADEATLDVLRCLVRRIELLPAVLILTYRDDETGWDHPLRHLLGVAATAERLPLRRLSLDAVRELSAGHDIDVDELYAVTTGNPFFVSEVLATGLDEVPRTVLDGVMARLAGLDQASRQAVEQLSVIPMATCWKLAAELIPGGLEVLAPAEERGLLSAADQRISFRHELTRRAIADAVPATRRAALNATVLAALVADPDADVARVVHHATEAGDDAAVARYGPEAARAAAAKGSHREAAAYYRLVLRDAQVDSRAELLTAYAVECSTLGQTATAVAAQREAVELQRSFGDVEVVAEGLLLLSRLEWWNGDRAAAERNTAEALKIVAQGGTASLLAHAYSHRAVLDGLAYRTEAAGEYGRRAISLAPGTVLPHMLTDLRIARWTSDQALLAECRRIVSAASDTRTECNAYLNTAWGLLDRYRLDLAAECVDSGIALADRVEEVSQLDALHLQWARLRMLRGDYDDALRILGLMVAKQPGIASPALALRGRILARRGDSGEELAEAVRVAERMGELQFLAPAYSAAIEAGWLRSDPALPQLVAAAVPVYEETVALNAEVCSAELGYWLSRAGYQVDPLGQPLPYAWLTADRWREAAAEWKRLGCRYEHALALSHSPHIDDLVTALRDLDTLGATPLAAWIRRRLRDLGATRIPRGQAITTRRHRSGLTHRESEILDLVAAGLTNAEIAEQLVVSVRTAENHLAAVFRKLNVRTRHEAVAQLKTHQGSESRTFPSGSSRRTG